MARARLFTHDKARYTRERCHDPNRFRRENFLRACFESCSNPAPLLRPPEWFSGRATERTRRSSRPAESIWLPRPTLSLSPPTAWAGTPSTSTPTILQPWARDRAGSSPRFCFRKAAPPKRLVEKIFGETLRACRKLGITLSGGHTEITVGLDRPIVVGQMLGEVEPDKLVRKENQRPGDLVILTKGVAIEGTTVLAREKAEWLKGRIAPKHLRQAQRLLQRPGISVVRDAQVALEHGEVHAMHDPTEGGVLTGLVEMARAGRVGLRVWKEKIPVLAETRRLARVLKFDPLGLLASGALLIAAERSSAPRIVNALRRRQHCRTNRRRDSPRERWHQDGRKRPRPPHQSPRARRDRAPAGASALGGA